MPQKVLRFVLSSLLYCLKILRYLKDLNVSQLRQSTGIGFRYWRRMMFKRAWVRILASDMRWKFNTFIFVKLGFFKHWKLTKKSQRIADFFKKKLCKVARGRLKKRFYSVWFCNKKFFFNGQTPASFSFIFVSFNETLQFLQQINVKNVHPVSSAGIRTHDLWNVSPLP